MSNPPESDLAPSEGSRPDPSAPSRGGGGEELRLATHLRTLSLLAPGIAHDLRAPINAMAFNLEVMRETLARADGAPGGPNARLERYSDVLREELDRLHGRLETLFAYLLPTPLRRETIPLSTVLREIETLILPTARKRRIAISRLDPDDLVHLPGGPGPLREALLQVAVAALAEIASGGLLRLSGGAPAGGVRVTIEGEPQAPAIEPPGPLSDPNLQIAAAIVEASGGKLRRMATSVSNEPRVAFEVQFPPSRNPPNSEPA